MIRYYLPEKLVCFVLFLKKRNPIFALGVCKTGICKIGQNIQTEWNVTKRSNVGQPRHKIGLTGQNRQTNKTKQNLTDKRRYN